MGRLVIKERGVMLHKGVTKLAIVGTIVTLAAAFVDTIWAVHLNSFLHNEVLVGFFSATLTLLSFIAYFLFIPLIEKRDKGRIYAVTLFFISAFYALFAIVDNFYLFAFLAGAITVMYTLRVTSYGLLVRDSSKKTNLARNEGFVFTFTNISWVLGPLAAGYALSRLNFRFVFVLAAMFLLTGLVVFIVFGIRDADGKEKSDKHVLKNFRDFFKNKERSLAYVFGASVSFWWVLIYLYTPLEIIRHGLANSWIGYFLFAVAVPLILLEYTFSRWACNHGFKKLFKTAYLIVFCAVLSCFFAPNIYWTLGSLVFASVGIAMLEPATEAYFFDILKGKEHYRFYGPYNTALDAGHLISKISVAAILIFLPFKFVYLFYAVMMLVFFCISHKSKGIVESKRGRLDSADEEE